MHAYSYDYKLSFMYVHIIYTIVLLAYFHCLKHLKTQVIEFTLGIFFRTSHA